MMTLLADLRANTLRIEELDIVDSFEMHSLLADYEAKLSKTFGAMTVDELNVFFDFYFELLDNRIYG
jgi:hypothetical protein